MASSRVLQEKKPLITLYGQMSPASSYIQPESEEDVGKNFTVITMKHGGRSIMGWE